MRVWRQLPNYFNATPSSADTSPTTAGSNPDFDPVLSNGEVAGISVSALIGGFWSYAALVVFYGSISGEDTMISIHKITKLTVRVDTSLRQLA